MSIDWNATICLALGLVLAALAGYGYALIDRWKGWPEEDAKGRKIG